MSWRSTRSNRHIYPMMHHTIIQVMGQYNYVECMLKTCILLDVAKLECGHNDSVYRIEICLKTRRHTLSVSRFFSGHTFECTPVFYAVLRVSRSHTRRSDSSFWYKRHWTVHADICCLVNDPIFKLRFSDVAMLSVKATLSSSRLMASSSPFCMRTTTQYRRDLWFS